LTGLARIKGVRKMRGRVLYALAVVALAAVTGWALGTTSPRTPASSRHDYFVSADGSDAGDGSADAPWRTLQRAADSIGPGSTVYVRGGVYSQTVAVHASGSASGGFITFRNYPGEHPVLDGARLSVPDGLNGMITIDSRDYVTIRGFELRDYRTAEPGHVPVGIFVTGDASHVRIFDNSIHGIQTNVQAHVNGDAHGIVVYGTQSPNPIHDIVIDGNQVYGCKLGSSESLVLNGNVTDFRVTNNVVHDNDNIGIDLIGYEGTAGDSTYDAARDGIVRGNLVFNIDSYGNPAYGRDRSANGIYIDGGRDIVVEQNVIHDVNIGMEFASEREGRSTSYITARSNLVFNSTVIGLAIGGYDRRRGNTEHTVIVNNTFYQDDSLRSGNGELLVQFDTRDNVIENNIFSANGQNLFTVNPYTENSGNHIDHNVYFSPGGSRRGTWQWKDVTYESFDAYRRGSGNDRHSIYADPGFVDAASGDFRLQPSSPAIDAGAFLLQAGTRDLVGVDRAENGSIDVGAYESPAPPPSPIPSITEPTIPLTQMQWVSATGGWGPIERDMSNGERAPGDGGVITINGQSFESGLGAHAPSRIEYRLGGRCSAFLADVGIDDEVGNQGSVVFQVWGDGQRLYDSGILRGVDGAAAAYADLSGVGMLELVVTGAGDGIGNDHADWAGARVACG
jgi:hypothetical protein